jgi:hypothetical protein
MGAGEWPEPGASAGLALVSACGVEGCLMPHIGIELLGGVLAEVLGIGGDAGLHLAN